MKKVLGLLLARIMIFGLAACGAENTNEKAVTIENTTSESESKDIENQTTEIVTENTEDSSAKTLVVYFSATGTTEKIAQTVADELSADIYEIIPAEVYTDDDLDYNDKDSRATKEQNDSSIRPEISGTIDNWDQYDTVLIGHPIWWGQEPRIMDTFVESYDFTGKTVTTFCTSGSSDIGNSGKNLEVNAGTGTWISGKRFAGDASSEDIAMWLKEIGLKSN